MVTSQWWFRLENTPRGTVPNIEQVEDRCVRPDPAVRTTLDDAIGKALRFFQETFQPGDVYSSERLRWPERLGATHRKVVDGQGGFWIGELEADTTLESDYILFLYFLDRDAHRAKIRKLANYIRREQLEDGTWNIFRGGPPELRIVEPLIQQHYGPTRAILPPDNVGSR